MPVHKLGPAISSPEAFPCRLQVWGFFTTTPLYRSAPERQVCHVLTHGPHPSYISPCHLHSPSFTREETETQRGEVMSQTKCQGQPTDTYGLHIKVVATVSSSFKNPRQNLLRRRRRWTMSFRPGQARIYKLHGFKGPHHEEILRNP